MSFQHPLFISFIIAFFLGFSLLRNTLLVYWIVFFSAMFYCTYNVKAFLLLTFIASLDFGLAILIDKTKSKKIWLSLSIFINLGCLIYFKYVNFFIENTNSLLSTLHQTPLPLLNVMLPLGISFFTFETLSYTIDVYRGQMKPIYQFKNYLLFISFFPHLAAGPIVRAKDFLPQIETNFKAKANFSGLFLVLMGLLKKLVLADALLSPMVDPIFESPTLFSSFDCLLGAYAYSFQIFFDFSGYSDIAIGLARMMGIDLGINFNSPYLSQSFKEFWERWHISLSQWFRDYVYLPLGGNRVSLVRSSFNILTVFLLSGLWHGAHWKFIFWGFLHGIFLISERVIFKYYPQWKPSPQRINLLRLFFIFNIVSLAWVFFRAASFQKACALIHQIFLLQLPNFSVGLALSMALLALSAIHHSLIETNRNAISDFFYKKNFAYQFLFLCLFSLFIFEISLRDLGNKAFIYFQF